ncbi:hypothetical protein SG34_025190 [Thalassomonas viridans]|uniref:Uncharacterized protein n=1 Tax=Thalassomonas viridans TaxID=137584 RepID=A0AAF0C8V7_9GAMM|nr:hypothetical protein [Thalassomonas viridans]WDE04590.1 hypothetical protein SG34_025190 [Thalassomonas viridans]
MRAVVKKRLLFFIFAALIYTLGFQLLPESLHPEGGLISLMPLILASTAYFLLIPFLYWFLIIRAGNGKSWKLLLILLLSCMMARYSYPEDIARYFEFITWLRYPVIGILLLIEFYLMFTIVKGLWQARKLSGDPRVHVVNKYPENEKKQMLALTMAWEPASWYYALPRFSRNHVPAIARLSLRSAHIGYFIVTLLLLFTASGASYWLLNGWSETLAIIVASFICYSVIFIGANFRVSRHYSVYLTDGRLVINASFLNFAVFDLDDISEIRVGSWSRAEDSECLMLGRGDKANVELNFSREQSYAAMVGMASEKVSRVRLNVDDSEALRLALLPFNALKLAS